MIPKLTKSEIEDCLNDIKRLGIHGLKGLEIKQCVQLLDEVRERKIRETKLAAEILVSNSEYPYPEEYKNGHEIEYWFERTGNYYPLENIENILIKHLNPEPEINEQPEQEPAKKPTKPPKGKNILSREQIAILFWYLRGKSLIAPNLENKSISTALEILTGNESKQFQQLLRQKDAKVFQLGKKDHQITSNDMQRVIDELNSLINSIKSDFQKYKDEFR